MTTSREQHPLPGPGAYLRALVTNPRPAVLHVIADEMEPRLLQGMADLREQGRRRR